MLAARRREQRLGDGEVARVRDLDVLGRAGDQLRPQADRLDRRRLVGRFGASRQRVGEHAEAEHLRRLRLPDVVARQRRDGAIALGALERVGDRQREQAADAVVRGRRRRARRSIRRGPGSARRRGRAPSRWPSRRARRAWRGRRRRSSARVVPPQRASARRGSSGSRGQGCRSARPRARRRPGSGSAAARPTSAASVCATSGRPATSTYCLATAAPARTPLPAHGTSAKRRRRLGAGSASAAIDRGGAKDKPQARAAAARHLKSLLCSRAARDFLPPSCFFPTSPPASASRCPARPARPTPCCSPASPRRSAPAPRSSRSSAPSPPTRSASPTRSPFFAPALARRRLPRLGDAALRHLLAARGPDLRAAGDALAHPAAATSTSS